MLCLVLMKLLVGDASPDMARLKRGPTRDADYGKSESDTRKSGGSFESDLLASPSRVFSSISENGNSRFGNVASPIGKLRGPERILFRGDNNKENVLNFDQKEDLIEESIFSLFIIINIVFFLFCFVYL